MRHKKKRRNKTLFINILCLLAGVCAGILVVSAGVGIAGRKAQKEQNISKADEAAAQPEEITTEAETEPEGKYDFTVCFAGDVNFDDTYFPIQHMDKQENGLEDCISADLLKIMQDADLMCLNNEFTYSTGGAPLENKLYTFRANPKRVSLLSKMGVDVVTLANNHVYDYGKQAMLDTFDTLENAGISYFGAGRNLEEAMKPVYVEIGGKTIALVAASRAEKYRMTPQATEDEPGILRCYNTELFLQVIKEAKQNADFVIAYVHWGTEHSFELEDVQLSTAREYADAGADVVIGAHPHCLQGMEYYDEKPIIYSLGNFWFDDADVDTMLLQLHFYGDDENQQLEVKVIPAVQSNCTTTGVTEKQEQRRIFDFLEEISINVAITKDGVVVPAE